MIRSSAGISKIAVSDEVDPGFGPDTEQRRVEFAAKMEQEAFSIALGDATRIARANLITALKLWDKEKLIPKVKKLELREIMLIWLLFEIAYLTQIWNDLSLDGKKVTTDSEKNLSVFIKRIFAALFQNVPNKILKIKVDREFIESVRECFGGDLIFSLKQKNDIEVVKVFEITESKLPKSLREKLYNIVIGVELLYTDIIKILNSKADSLLKSLIEHVVNALKADEEYGISNEQMLIMTDILKCFDKESADVFEEFYSKGTQTSSKEVEDKVKKFYGINSGN